MNVTIKSLALSNLLHSPYICQGKSSLHISNSIVTKSFHSFVYSDGRLKIKNSKFSQFLDTPVKVISQSYSGKTIQSVILDKTADIDDCTFVNCRNRAILSDSPFGNLTITKSKFDRCSTVPLFREVGGAIFAKNVFTKLLHCEFTMCYSHERAHAIYTDTSSEFQNLDFIIADCHPQIRTNRDTVCHINGKQTVVNGNITRCYAEANAGVFIENILPSQYMYLTLSDLSGGHAMFLRTIREIQNINVINCICIDGLFTSDQNDVWLKSFYLENNTGGIVYRQSQYIVTLTDCIFKDYSEAPRARNLAIRGTFSLEDSSATPFHFVKKVEVIVKNEPTFWTVRRIVAAAISGTVGFFIILLLLKQCCLLCCQAPEKEESSENVGKHRKQKKHD